MLEERCQTGNRLDDVGGLVHDDQAAGAERRFLVAHAVKVHDGIHHVFALDDRARCTAGNNRQQIVPAAANAAAVLFDQITERNAEAFFDDARRVHMARNLEQLGADIVRASDGREPGRATTQDRRRNGNRFHVVHGRRAAIKAHICREWRLQTRLALLAFKAFEQSCFFATDVSTGAVGYENIHIPAALVALAEQTGLVALVDSGLQRFTLTHELAANINIGSVCAHGATGDYAAFDQRMRIVAQNFAVLAGARLGFVGIDDQIMRATVALLRHERPLETCREASAATATQARRFHLVDDPVTALFDQTLGVVPMAARHGTLQGLILEAVNIGEDAIFISQHVSPVSVRVCQYRSHHTGFFPNTLMYSSTPPLAKALACFTQSSRSMRPWKLR